jgi:hypothetical protein
MRDFIPSEMSLGIPKKDQNPIIFDLKTKQLQSRNDVSPCLAIDISLIAASETYCVAAVVNDRILADC